MRKQKEGEVRIEAGAGVNSGDWFEGRKEVKEVVGNSAQEARVSKAKEKPKEAAESVKVVEIEKVEEAVALPDLGKIKTKKLTKKDIAEQEKEYRRRKEYSEQAGKRLTEIEAEIAKISEKFPDWELVPKVREEMKGLKIERQTITGIADEGLQAHIGLSQYIEEIREAVKEENIDKVDSLVEKAVELGRYEWGTEEKTVGKSNKIYYRRGVLIPTSDSPATKAVATELRKLVAASKGWRRDVYREAVKALKAKPVDMTVRDIVHHHPTPGTAPEGIVYCFLPSYERKDDKSGENRRVSESHFLVVCDGTVIKPLEAAGRLEKVFKEWKSKKRFLPVSFLRSGRVSETVTEEVKSDLIRFLGLLRAVYWREQEEYKLQQEAAVARKLEEQKKVAKAKAKKKVVKTETEAPMSFEEKLLTEQVQIGLTADPIKM